MSTRKVFSSDIAALIVRHEAAVRLRLWSFLHDVRLQRIVGDAAVRKLERACHSLLRREKHGPSRGGGSRRIVCRRFPRQRSTARQRIKGICQSDLKPGETRRVTLTLDRRAFSFYDVTKKDWSAEPGDFTILVGGSSDNIQLRGKFTLAH